MLAAACDSLHAVSPYLEDIAQRIESSFNRRGFYPILTSEYRKLIAHPLDNSNEYLAENTKGSVLYPLLVAWVDRLSLQDSKRLLISCLETHLPHTTQQIWVPDAETDDRLWLGRLDHGVSVGELPLDDDSTLYSQLLDRVIADHPSIDALSAIRSGNWPLFLMACRHFRLPVPPHFWFRDL